MKITTFTDYSLRVLIHVASAPDGRATIAGVARAFGISENHLVKVVHLLGREGFLATTRGRGGGLRLARAARDINVADVVRATEGGVFPVECIGDGANDCAIARVCKLPGVLSKAMDAFYAVLESCTLQDLVAEKAPLRAILHRMPART